MKAGNEKMGFIKEFEYLLKDNSGKDIEWFLKTTGVASFAISIATILILFTQNTTNFYITMVALAAFFTPFPLHYMLHHYLSELKKRKREQLIPDILLQASAFPKGTSFGKIIDYFSNARFGLLGKEFEKAQLEIGKGASVQQALDNISKRCRSDIVGRAMRLLKQGYVSGADMSTTFRETADDLLETNAILRERNAALVIEKYTLLFAGGFIVPAILGLLVGMVGSMDFAALELLEFGASAAEKGALLESTILANQIYIVEYSLLAAFFVALLEGNPKKVLVYAAFLLPISLISFNAAQFFLL
ncbi:MAG: hypothetical protein CL943_00890 [Candidatus Diapherotrites archaeon]|uniref:Type II secretion system protein GspF domain-containing protein n=1 Tax=Candidatus Iainarchaeum sp. TaxID=3101447 RepID=A0A2D6M099_9ARCH|nr:hypothetical protein [Candidatus Diapherotrites archaeon]|tara:strand:- start:1465 stop:2376 length:912 start_codon:yes stop_codon:yes gene_type:complete